MVAEKSWKFEPGKPAPDIEADNDNNAPPRQTEPVDLWQQTAHPDLPVELLPSVIADFATGQAELMGVDPGGLAMAALTVCAAAIPDTLEIQPKQHDPNWRESARIWTAVIGLPSTKKSPLLASATKPLKAIDQEMFRTYLEAKAAYDALAKDDKKTAAQPRHERLRLEDTTIEAAQDVLKDSPNGVLLVQDELSGWFGGMDKYAGAGRGAAKDRSFWLQSFNGGSYTVNRVMRGSSFIPNLSVCLLGGIQPEPIRAIAKDMQDDGLLQRLFPIVLRPATMGTDAPAPAAAGAYGALIEKCHRLSRPIQGGMLEVPIRFTPEAQIVWEEVLTRNFALAQSWEKVNVKLAAHIGKYDGLFARLCLLWHCIESTGSRPASTIPADVAERVRDFLFRYLYPHALAFYLDVVGLSDRQDKVLATAGWILTHRPQKVNVRQVRRGDRLMRSMDNLEAEKVLDQLDAFGWLDPVPVDRRDSRQWKVDPKVYDLFAERAREETDRRLAVREIIASNAKLRAA